MNGWAWCHNAHAGGARGQACSIYKTALWHKTRAYIEAHSHVSPPEVANVQKVQSTSNGTATPVIVDRSAGVFEAIEARRRQAKAPWRCWNCQGAKAMANPFAETPVQTSTNNLPALDPMVLLALISALLALLLCLMLRSLRDCCFRARYYRPASNCTGTCNVCSGTQINHFCSRATAGPCSICNGACALTRSMGHQPIVAESGHCWRT